MTSDQMIPLLRPHDHGFTRGDATRPDSPDPQPPAHAAERNQSGDRAADRRLVAGLLERSPQAWSEFVDRYERLIVSRVIAACREVGFEPAADLVEDCGGEVIAALFHNDLRGLRQFRGHSRLSTWLAVVSRRTTLSHLRRRHRESCHTTQPDSKFDLATVPDARGPRLPEHTDRQTLAAGLAELSEADRRILKLRFERELSYAEIATLLGISENTVGPKLQRARARLQSAVEQMGDPDS